MLPVRKSLAIPRANLVASKNRVLKIDLVKSAKRSDVGTNNSACTRAPGLNENFDSKILIFSKIE